MVKSKPTREHYDSQRVLPIHQYFSSKIRIIIAAGGGNLAYHVARHKGYSFDGEKPSSLEYVVARKQGNVFSTSSYINPLPKQYLHFSFKDTRGGGAST